MKPIDQLSIDTIRVLSAEGVQKANSGHPGMPLGSAPMAYTLFSKFLKANPHDTHWADRDRFVLSAGHASMLLYSLLHLFEYGLLMEDLKQFRQFNSKTPGHPEYRHTNGVETSTGPLGQGVANAVGFAIAERRLAAQFNRPGFEIVDHYTYALVGDGCMMEGIASEACSLAGTLELSKLIVLYDCNKISIEGDTSIAFRENVGLRYEAYGWHVQHVQDGNDVDAIAAAIEAAKQSSKPSLIIVHTLIGYGCPSKQGKASAHGEPLGQENLVAMKKQLGWEYGEEFHVPQEVRMHMADIAAEKVTSQIQWQTKFDAYCAQYPDLAAAWKQWHEEDAPDFTQDPDFWAFSGKMATRNSSGIILERMAKKMPNLIGGSADLSPSNKSYIKDRGDFSAEDPSGSNMHFGVREHAMAAICNGIQLHGGLRAYCSTFFVFSDYMKHSMRLSALMKLPVLYVLTHDSIGVGEDGPTHQPIEQLAMLRSLPDMTVFRPADSKEVAAAYAYAARHDGPTSIVLTRQDLPLYEQSGEQAMKGAYILSDCEKDAPDLILIATGSEVELAMGAQAALILEGLAVRVVSMPSMEVFERQDKDYQQSVLPNGVRKRLAIEAASSFGWHKYVGLDGDVISIDTFGASAPAPLLFQHFGLTVENVINRAHQLLG